MSPHPSATVQVPSQPWTSALIEVCPGSAAASRASSTRVEVATVVGAIGAGDTFEAVQEA